MAHHSSSLSDTWPLSEEYNNDTDVINALIIRKPRQEGCESVTVQFIKDWYTNLKDTRVVPRGLLCDSYTCGLDLGDELFVKLQFFHLMRYIWVEREYENLSAVFKDIVALLPSLSTAERHEWATLAGKLSKISNVLQRTEAQHRSISLIDPIVYGLQPHIYSLESPVSSPSSAPPSYSEF